MSAEQIYQDLLNEMSKQQQQQNNQGQGTNSSSNNNQNNNQTQNNQDQNNGSQEQNKDEEKGVDGKGYDDTFPNEKERDNNGQVNLDVHLDQNDPKIQEDMREASIRVKQILEQAASQGKLSNGFRRFIDSLPKVKENWRYHLDRYLKSFKKAESSWKRPNKRFFCGGDPVRGGFYLPTRFDTPELNVAIGIDTSGSISDKQISEFFGHIYKILKSYKHFTIQIFCWSTQVHEGTYRELNEKNIHTFDPLDKDWIESYGGTIAQPAFDYVSKLKKKPDVFINFTDGYFESEIKFDTCPVIFAIRKQDNESFTIPTGCKRAIHIKIED